MKFKHIGYNAEDHTFNVNGVEFQVDCSDGQRGVRMSQYIDESLTAIEEGLRALSRAQDPNHVYQGLSDQVRRLDKYARSLAGKLEPIDKKIDGGSSFPNSFVQEDPVIITVSDGRRSVELRISGYEKGMLTREAVDAVRREYINQVKDNLDTIEHVFQTLQDSGGF